MKVSRFYYKVNDKKLNKRIVVLADIHYYSKKNIKKLNKVLNNSLKLNPDYFCIPGDMFDEKNIYDVDYFIEWLRKLSKIAPVIISIGNHEYYDKERTNGILNTEVYRKVKKVKNVYVLDNDYKNIYGINFIGLSLPIKYYSEKKENDEDFLIDYANKNINFNIKKGYSILLSHTPIELSKEDVLKKLKCSKYVNLIISGHTHGGITPNVLKYFMNGTGFISPSKKLFPKRTYGKFIINGINFIVSSGITKASHTNTFRFFDFLFSPEISIIDL